MATNNNSNRYPSEKGRFFKGKTFILLVGLLLGAGIMVAVYKTSVYFSSDESMSIRMRKTAGSSPNT